MSRRAVLQVARWEFLRYLKPKQQLVAMLLTFVMGLVGFGLARVSKGSEDRVRTVAVIGTALPVQAHAGERLRFTAHDAADQDSLRAAVAAGDLDALLLIRDSNHASLVMRRRGGWSDNVRAALASARQQEMLRQAGLSADALAQMLAPPQLDIVYEAGSNPQDRSARIALIIMLSLMLMVVFIGMSYIFASITGEKQIRVTEQVVSAIPAQAWIDGKIMGLIGVSLVSVAGTAAAFLALLALFARGRIALPDTLGNPVTVLLIVVFAVLGLCFWFAFLAAVAAMIDDPHNSTRGSLLFVPLFATSFSFMIGNNPDSAFARTLSLLPPTAPSAMPARMFSGYVNPLEILLSLALLIGSVWFLRLAAGRVFRLAMLMYGKEPTWAEVRKWVFNS